MIDSRLLASWESCGAASAKPLLFIIIIIASLLQWKESRHPASVAPPSFHPAVRKLHLLPTALLRLLRPAGLRQWVRVEGETHVEHQVPGLNEAVRSSPGGETDHLEVGLRCDRVGEAPPFRHTLHVSRRQTTTLQPGAHAAAAAAYF